MNKTNTAAVAPTLPDRFISRRDTSAATRAAESFRRTGRPVSPFTAYPERESYLEIETYERPDGSRYERTRSVSRWAGVDAVGEWTVSP